MQFSKIFTVLAVAMTAAAAPAPAELAARTSATCADQTNHNSPVCCSSISTILGGLVGVGCLEVSILGGGACANRPVNYCCSPHSVSGGLINISGNCVGPIIVG